MIRTFLAPSLDLALTVPAPILVTVEAEYGAVVIEGSLYTAAHHQPAGSPFAGNHIVMGGRPAPCNDEDIPELDSEDVSGTILISHLDLDTIGGVLRAEGRRGLFLGYKSFWALAGWVDVHGVHKLGLVGASDQDLWRLNAWWAYSKGMPRLPRDRVSDVTEIIHAAGDALAGILTGDEVLLAAGDTFRAAEAELNQRTFRHVSDGGIIARVSDRPGDFVSHLYRMPDGSVGEAIVAWNTANGTITVSRSNPSPELSCREMVQGLWGPEAGGHDGIAGSPRGRVMTEADFGQLLCLVSACIERNNNKLESE
jgi:hypothetical protein